jgi:hypothetical protein
VLAARVEFKGEQLPLRTAQAQLAVLSGYEDRDELGRLASDVSATFNGERLDVLRAGEKLEADVSGIADAVERNEEEKGISIRELERALASASKARAHRAGCTTTRRSCTRPDTRCTTRAATRRCRTRSATSRATTA